MQVMIDEFVASDAVVCIRGKEYFKLRDFMAFLKNKSTVRRRVVAVEHLREAGYDVHHLVIEKRLVIMWRKS